jgi:uncharacterized membrane protein YqaE (UPF0057 family)
LAIGTGALALALALSLPPLRVLIEQGMVWHMLVQMPLLVLSGWCAAAVATRRTASITPGRTPRRWAARLAVINRFGLTGFMLAQVLMAYWMVPAMVDRAVVLPAADAAKLASLWLAGVALQQGFRQAPLAVQLFFVGYGLPMLAWLGLYLAGTDLRLCNAYALQSQWRAGQGLLVLAVCLGLGWACSVRSALVRGSLRNA